MRKILAALLCTLVASMLLACGGGDTDAATARTAPALPSPSAPGDLPSATQLLSYAELAFDNFFPTHESDRTLAPYTYRFYPGTQNAVGVAGGLIYALGPAVRNNTTPVQVARVADFACDAVPAACGDRFDHAIKVGGVDRSFIVWRSYKARQSGNAPVVFMLYGTSGTGEEFLRRSGWREKADREGLIAVFPQALVHCYMQDEDFDGIPDRSVFTKWAAEASDLFAAAHCASSVVSVDTLAQRGISVVHSMGNLDPDQGRLAGYYDATTQTMTPMPLDESLIRNPKYAGGFIKPFLDVLQMAQTYTWSQPSVAGRKTSRFEFSTSTVGRGNIFRDVVIEGLAHEYPNGKNHPIVMADEIWEFFKAYRLP